MSAIHTNNAVKKAIFALVGLAILAAGTGCDSLGLGNLLGYDLGGLGFGGYGFPDTTYYDPYYDIQSVIDYRQDVMDWSADAWSDYILQ